MGKEEKYSTIINQSTTLSKIIRAIVSLQEFIGIKRYLIIWSKIELT